MGSRVVAYDTETRGLSWHDPNCRAFLGSWADADGEYVADLSDPKQAETFINALREADVLVAHNHSFDCHHVREALGLDVLSLGKQLEDTDLISRVLHPEGQRVGERGGHGLKNLAKVYLRQDAGDAEAEIERMAKSIGVKLKGGDGGYYDTWRAYPEPMEHYAKLDARYTFDLYTRFSKELDGRIAECYDLERAVMPILIRAEQRGVALDQTRVLELKRQYETRRDELHEQLEQELGADALGGNGSEAALLEALQSLGIPLHKKTKTGGQLSTDKFALQEFEDTFPVIAHLQEFRQMEKFLSTYVNPMVGKDTLHPSFWQCGAWTGRMSCSSPNLQNIPVRSGSEVRAVFVPREGYSFVVCDYDSIEIRLLAYYMGNQGYRDLVASNDPHAWMASNIWGGSPDDFAKGGPNDDKRALAKNVLFAICYGAGAPRVANMLHEAGMPSSREEAKALIAKIKKSLPGFFKLNKRIRDKIESVGYVETLFGRKQVVKPDKSYVGMNALIQGSAADVFKAGVVAVERCIKEYGAHQILFVHDEIVIEAPTHQAEIVLAEAIAAMEAAADISPGLKVTGKVVHESYAEAK